MTNEITLKNCLRAKDYIKKIKDISDQEAFKSYFDYNEAIIEQVVINLDPKTKNQAEQLATGHMILSLDIAEKIILSQRKLE